MKQDNGLPKLSVSRVTTLCDQYAAYSQESAAPLSESQEAITKKMLGVEVCFAQAPPFSSQYVHACTSSTSSLLRSAAVNASSHMQALCTRMLYLMNLRSSELNACAKALRELPTITTELAETRAYLMECEAQLKSLEEARHACQSSLALETRASQCSIDALFLSPCAPRCSQKSTKRAPQRYTAMLAETLQHLHRC